jgi:hypothetical protein
VQRMYWAILAGVVFGTTSIGFAGVTQPATITIVHGINGTDVEGTESFAVDVKIDGDVTQAGAQFRSFSEAIEIPAETTTIEVSLADAGEPGSNPPIATAEVELESGLDYSVLLHLNLAGEPELTVFFNDLSQLAGRNTFRQTVRHGAVAPMIDVIWYPVRAGSAPFGVIDVSNSEEGGPADFGVSLRYSHYNREVEDSVTGEVLLGPTPARPVRRTYYYLYLVGSVENGTLETLEEIR